MSLAGIAAWHARNARRRAVSLLAAGALCASTVADIATGPAMLPVADVLAALTGRAAKPMQAAIVLQLRLPIALMAIAVGAALGVSGAVMQAILRNPLASSYMLGISSAAAFGAALAIVAGAILPLGQEWAIPGAAFLFAALACALVGGMGQLRGAGPEMLVLAGIACLFLFQALLALLQFLASPEALAQIVFWVFGSLLRATHGTCAIVAAALVIALPLLLRDAWRLTALQLGEDRAGALGVNVAALRLRGFVIVSLLTGVAVAFVGTIGFIGLVAPHIARLLLGEDQRHLLPAAAPVGALLLSCASVASKLILPGTVIPIGILTALIGVPFFAWLIASRRSFAR